MSSTNQAHSGAKIMSLSTPIITIQDPYSTKKDKYLMALASILEKAYNSGHLTKAQKQHERVAYVEKSLDKAMMHMHNFDGLKAWLTQIDASLHLSPEVESWMKGMLNELNSFKDKPDVKAMRKIHKELSNNLYDISAQEAGIKSDDKHLASLYSDIHNIKKEFQKKIDEAKKHWYTRGEIPVLRAAEGVALSGLYTAVGYEKTDKSYRESMIKNLKLKDKHLEKEYDKYKQNYENKQQQFLDVVLNKGNQMGNQAQATIDRINKSNKTAESLFRGLENIVKDISPNNS